MGKIRAWQRIRKAVKRATMQNTGAMLFYVLVEDGTASGPHSVPFIRNNLLQGNYSPDVQVCINGTRDYLPLDDWRDVFFPERQKELEKAVAGKSAVRIYLGIILTIIGISNYFASFWIGFYSGFDWVSYAVSIAAAFACGVVGVDMVVNPPPPPTTARQSIGLTFALVGVAFVIWGFVESAENKLSSMWITLNGMTAALIGCGWMSASRKK